MSNTTQKKQIQKPRIGVYGLTGCAGDQLLIIHTEDEILNLFGAADIRSFVMASSQPIEEELDVALIEGSVSTQEQAEHVKEIEAIDLLLPVVRRTGPHCFLPDLRPVGKATLPPWDVGVCVHRGVDWHAILTAQAQPLGEVEGVGQVAHADD